ncbi:hypothetical protein LDENG_00292830 [Lucifuga dentata]|nr:hypothetical protein LDENG_00292830 [Lucifuga dentata]
MSKDDNDNPPSYEDALRHSMYGSYPQQPQDSAVPPPPAYSPSPGMYDAQPVNMGQMSINPQTSRLACPGPSSFGMPMIPTLSAGVPTSNPGFEAMTPDFIYHILDYM